MTERWWHNMNLPFTPPAGAIRKAFCPLAFKIAPNC